MNVKRWLLASAAVLVVIGVTGYVVHEVLLADIYKQTASVWRPQEDFKKLMWLFWPGNVIFALMFAFLYVKGYESAKPGLGQGLRFGVYIWLFTGVAMAFGWYVVLPIPATLSIYWVIAGLVESLVAGAAVGLIYK